MENLKHVLSTSDTWCYELNGTVRQTKGSIYVGYGNASRLVFPSFKKLINSAIGDSTKSFNITQIVLRTRRADDNSNISFQVRVNNNNTTSGGTEGNYVAFTSNSSSSAFTSYDITNLKDIFKTSDNNLVVHLTAPGSKNNIRFKDPTNHGEKHCPRIIVYYEIVEDSGGGDSGGGDSGGGEDTEETVTLDNVTAYLNTSSPTIGNTLSVTVSGAPSGSSYSYSWYLSNTSVGAYSSSWYSGNINVSSYFGSSSKTSSGYVAVTVSYGTLTKTLYPSFTLYLTSSYGPSNLTYSDKSSHSSGSYIPGSKIIWSASAIANYGASISRYVLTVNSVTDTVYGASVSNYTSSILPTTQGTYNASIDAYDSRGYSISRSFTITVSSNIAPTINAKVIRCDADGDENMISGKYYKLTGTVSADQTSGAKYITSLKITASQDGNTNPTISREPKVTSYDLSDIGVQALPTGAETSFEVKITASDGKMSREITLFGPSAAYIIHIATGGKSLGLGSAASKAEKTIACGWKLLANGGLEIDGSQITINNCLPISQGGTGASTAEGARANLGITDIDLSSYVTSKSLTEKLKKYLLLTGGTMTGNIKLNSTSSKIIGPGDHNLLWGYSDGDVVLGNSTGSCYLYSYGGNNKIATMGDIPDVPTFYYQTNRPTNGSYGDIWLEPI